MTDSDRDVDHSRIVADADVLAADLLVGGESRTVLDIVRSHSWLDLVATGPLLDDAEGVIAALSDAGLSGDWRAKIEELAVVVDQPHGDHPALAAAYRGNAPHVVSLDDRLQRPEAGANLRGVMDVSVRSPDAFATVFDPAAAYERLFDDAYDGPDRDPRA